MRARPGPQRPRATAVMRALAGARCAISEDGILRYLGAQADSALLDRVAAVIAVRRRAHASPAATDAPGAGGQPGARGLEAIGLQASARPASSLPPAAGLPARGEPIRDALLEALEAYGALGDDGVLRAAADALARQLAMRMTPLR